MGGTGQPEVGKGREESVLAYTLGKKIEGECAGNVASAARILGGQCGRRMTTPLLCVPFRTFSLGAQIQGKSDRNPPYQDKAEEKIMHMLD